MRGRRRRGRARFTVGVTVAFGLSMRVWSLRGRVLVCAVGLQAEGYGDGFGGFDGLTVERGGLVMPLADGVCGGGNEQRRAGHLVDVLDVAVTGDDGAQFHDAFDALMLGVFRVSWFDARN